MPDTWTQPQIDLGLSVESAAAYGQAEVVRLTGATVRQVDDWVRKGTVVSSVQAAAGSGTRRLYSFRDIVAIRMLKRLSDVGISPHNLTRAVQTLRRLGDDDLASTTLLSDGRTVYQCRSDNEVIDLLRGGQCVIAIALNHVVAEVMAAEPRPTADLSKERRMRRGATARGATATG